VWFSGKKNLERLCEEKKGFGKKKKRDNLDSPAGLRVKKGRGEEKGRPPLPRTLTILPLVGGMKKKEKRAP